MIDFNYYKHYKQTWWQKAKRASYRLFYRMTKPFRTLLSVLIYKEHIVDMRDKRWGYSGGYCDPMESVKFACFKILCNFIEKDKPFETIDTSEEPHYSGFEDIKKAYNWINKERPDLLKEADHILKNHEQDWPVYDFVVVSDSPKLYELVKKKDWGEFALRYNAIMDEVEKKDQETLDKIVKNRHFLWV